MGLLSWVRSRRRTTVRIACKDGFDMPVLDGDTVTLQLPFTITDANAGVRLAFCGEIVLRNDGGILRTVGAARLARGGADSGKTER